jgi:hypothetical protein
MIDQGRLEYWKPGKSYRMLRVFMSHRWVAEDQKLYGDVFTELGKMGLKYQDMSLDRSRKIQGPRGGDVNDFELSRLIAARIFSSDIVIAPSRRGAGQSDWIAWEVELAAIAYSLPVLFVDHDHDVQRRNFLVSSLKAAGATFDVAEPSPYAIAGKAMRLVNPDIFAGVRMPESYERTEIYRGPLQSALTEIMLQYPYQSK